MKITVYGYKQSYMRGVFNLSVNGAPADCIYISEFDVDDSLMPTPEEVAQIVDQHEQQNKKERVAKLREEIAKLEGEL